MAKSIEVGSIVRTKSGRVGTVLSTVPMPDGSTTAYVQFKDVPTPDGEPFSLSDLELLSVE